MKKTIALLLACLLLLLLFTACGEKEKPKLSELSDEDMMAYLKENGIESPDDIYGEQFQDAAEVLRKRIKKIEDDPKGAFNFASIQILRSAREFPIVDDVYLVQIVNEYYGLDPWGDPEKSKLSEKGDQSMMSYLYKKGIEVKYDIYSEQFHEAAEALRTIIKIIEDDPKGANIFAASQMSNGVIWFPDVNNLDLVEIVNEYYGLDTFGEPLEK